MPVVIALNKVDRLEGGHIATQMQTAAKLGDFHALAPGEREDRRRDHELRDELVALLPEGPAVLPADQRSDLSLEAQVAELVREKALQLTREEVPHAISVEVEELNEKVLRASISSRPSRRSRSSSARAAPWSRRSGFAPAPRSSSCSATRSSSSST